MAQETMEKIPSKTKIPRAGFCKDAAEICDKNNGEQENDATP
jgi:hypothetical protein